jgi:hypothetical protein
MPTVLAVIGILFLVVVALGIFLYTLPLLANKVESPAQEDLHFSLKESMAVLRALNNLGQRAAPGKVAEDAGVSIPLAKAILNHLGKSNLVLRSAPEPIDLINKEDPQEYFEITPSGRADFIQYEGASIH